MCTAKDAISKRKREPPLDPRDVFGTGEEAEAQEVIKRAAKRKPHKEPFWVAVPVKSLPGSSPCVRALALQKEK